MKKTWAISLSCILTAGLVLGGCAKKNEAQPDDKGSAGGNEQTGKKVSLSILNGGWDFPANTDPNNNKWTAIFKEAFPNVDIKWELPPRNQLEQKKQLLMGSGEFPNMVPTNQTDMINWAKSGQIIPVDEYIKKNMPLLKNYLSEEDMKVGQVDGKQYLIPTPQSSIQNPVLLYIRKDWLDNLNLKMPTTTDELMAVMKAFTTQDPDKNGKNDTFGFASEKNLALMDSITFAFGVDLGGKYWHRVDGKLVPDFVSPKAKEALAFIREMYQSGVYDKESLVSDFKKLEEKATSGKYGIVPFYSAGMWGRLNANLKKSVPNGQFVVLPPVKGPKGESGFKRDRSIGQMWAITAGTSPEQADAATKLLNWFMEPDTSVPYLKTKGDALNMGQLNIHSKLLGNKYLEEIPAAQQPDEYKSDNYRFSYRIVFSSTHMLPDKERLEFRKLSETKGLYEDALIASQHGVYNAQNIAGPLEGKYLPDLLTYWDEEKMKIVTGDKPLSAFDDWVKYYYANHGQEIIDESNKYNPAK